MSVTDMGCVKEQTIRVLLTRCQKGQATIRELLESSFDRNPKENVKCEGPTVKPNILDEILDNLNSLCQAQILIIEFIKTKIEPKL